MQVVFDQDGNLVGIVDPAAITPSAARAAKPNPSRNRRWMTPPRAAPAVAGIPADDVTKAEATEPATGDGSTPDFATADS